MEKFSFFNDVNDDRVYYAEDWARHLKKYFTNGIFNNELNVVSNNDMTITIKEGDANIEGYRYTNTGDLVKTIDNADGTLNRIDNVVLRLDLTNRLISAQIIKGTFADKPVSPELVRTSTIYDLRIAKISIPAGTTTITQDLITDTRFITSDCGNVISTVQTPDTENLFIQMQTLFEKQINELNNNFEIWFDSIKNQLDSDAAGNLQNQINNLNSNKVDNAKFDLDSNNLQLLANGKNVGDSVHIPTGITDTATDEEDLKIVNNKGVVKFSLEGKTEQKSYTGKNILDYITKLNPSGNGLTNVINDDGSITTSGKPSVNYSQVTQKKEIIDELEDGQTYTISQAVANRVLYLEVAIKSKDGTYTYLSCNLPERKSVTFTVDKNVYVSYIITIQTTTTATFGDSSLTITNKYMLCKGTDTADSSFEPYVGGTQSPNPNYPQKIKNVRGVENLLKLPDGTYENNGITAVIKDGVITLNGTATSTSFITINLEKLKSGTYSMSANNEHVVGSTNINNDFASYRLANRNTAEILQDCVFGKKNSTANFIISNDININFTIRTAANLTYNNFVIKPQLEEGLIVHDYVPYGSNYLQLENKSKNILPHSLSQGSWNTTSTNTRVANYSNILIKSGTYTFSTDIDLTNYVVWVGTSTQKFPHLNWNIINEIKSWSAIKKITFTIEKEGYFLVMYRKKDDSTITPDEIKNIKQQLKIGSEAGEFEPYQKKIINIDLKGNNLCSNKDKTIKDELVIENGKAKIIKKYDEYVFTGNERFVGEIKSGLFCVNTKIQNMVSLLNRNINQMNSHFFNSTKDVVGGCFNNITNLYMFPTSDITSTDEFKALLKSLYDSGNPVKVQYELAEPKVIDLGEIDFELLEGNSTLNLEEDLKSNMSIKYYTDSTVVDLSKKVENKQNVILHGATAPTNDLGEDGDIYLQHN